MVFLPIIENNVYLTIGRKIQKKFEKLCVFQLLFSFYFHINNYLHINFHFELHCTVSNK